MVRMNLRGSEEEFTVFELKISVSDSRNTKNKVLKKVSKVDRARLLPAVPSETRGNRDILNARKSFKNRKKVIFHEGGQTGTGCPGRFWSLHPWTNTEANWMWSSRQP